MIYYLKSQKFFPPLSVRESHRVNFTQHLFRERREDFEKLHWTGSTSTWLETQASPQFQDWHHEFTL